MRVGDFELVDEPLHLGDAKGNRFEVLCCPNPLYFIACAQISEVQFTCAH